jgi:PiT family inorganic phosphate transporter
MTELLWVLIAVIVVALAFDVTNGMHDTANTVAPLVASRAVAPQLAVVLVAIGVAIGAVTAGGAVAATIGSGILPPGSVTLELVLAAISGAIVWNVGAWYLGVPCSSSLALVGGLVGAGLADALFGSGAIGAIGWSTVVDKVFVPSLLAPVVGGLIAAGIWVILVRLASRGTRRSAERSMRRTQIGAAMVQSYAQGANDAQKTMGVIALALVAYSQAGAPPGAEKAEFVVPFWVVLACAASIAFGTLAGGWRIVETMGKRLAKLDVAQSAAATFAGGVVLLLSSRYGMPVSTTYASVGSIMGAAATRGRRRVRWNVAGDILVAWAITAPCAALAALLLSTLAAAAPLALAVGVLVLLGWMLRKNQADGQARVAEPRTYVPPSVVVARSPHERSLLVQRSTPGLTGAAIRRSSAARP